MKGKDIKSLQGTRNVADQKDVADMEARIIELHREVVNLRSELFKTRDELHALKNARLLGKIIKTRDAIGSSRHSIVRLPYRTVHTVRVISAPFIPQPLRKALKKRYKTVRTHLNNRYENYSVTTTTVQNEKWKLGYPLVSVIIPYYNRADTIDDTLTSLQEQTFTNFETIIVNDGSTDQTSVQKLQDIHASNPSIKIIHQINQGVAAARNKGIKEARGKYIICLDSDDLLAPTYIEKATLVLETEPDVALVTSHQDMFGVIQDIHKNSEYDPIKLYKDNMIITAAEFRKEAWEISGGYEPGIGYEDWEFWLSLSEHGFWGKRIPEELFLYRTSLQSRYVEDKDVHWNNLKTIRTLHPNYKKNIKKLQAKRRAIKQIVDPKTALLNMQTDEHYKKFNNGRPNILIAIPWMTFGGAETLLYNYCSQIKDDYNITFITGLYSKNEWEARFKEITPYIYHLPNLFSNEALYEQFISMYIETRQINVLHIVHNGFVFPMLHRLKQAHPKLKVAVSMFNDAVQYFQQSIDSQTDIDIFTTDNEAVAKHFRSLLGQGKKVKVLPNGIDCEGVFNPELFDREAIRKELKVKKDEVCIFFIGRLSEEKEPLVFAHSAAAVQKSLKAEHAGFFMVGDGPLRVELETYLSQNKTSKLTYLGYQSDVGKYLSAADIFVLPSSVDGFPAAILEAMAMNVAVIASNVGAIPDVISSGKNGIIVTPASETEVSEAIIRLVNDKALLDRLKDNARQRIMQHFSKESLRTNYGGLYEELSATKSR